MTDSRGYIYFAIKTENQNLDLADFDKFLGIKPTKFDKMYSRGRIPKSTNWLYSTDELVNPILLDLAEGLIKDLEPYKDDFKRLKNEYPEVSFVLEVVFFLGDESPGLHFSRTVLNFLSYVGAVIDCDIYNEK